MTIENEALREKLLALMKVTPLSDYSLAPGIAGRVGKLLSDQAGKRAGERRIGTCQRAVPFLP